MNAKLLDQIVEAVLYEGYVLYPYRASSLKNRRQRFTFGRVYPETYSRAQHGAEPSFMQTECLVEAGSVPDGGALTRLGAKAGSPLILQVCVRFLQPVAREIGKLDELAEGGEPGFQRVPELQVGNELFQTWHEAVERRVDAAPLRLEPGRENSQRIIFDFPTSRTLESICDGPKVAGVVVRRQDALQGAVEIACHPLDARVFKVTVRILNQTPVAGAELQEVSLPRGDARSAAELEETVLLRTFASTHTILAVHSGAFLSLLDPVAEYGSAAAECKNLGTWPVLVGDQKNGERNTLLSSPIILSDYPEIAPESAGPLFDGTEIDEILTLRIRSMTDAEKLEMRTVDQHARQLLERTEALTQDSLLKLHGTMRQRENGASDEAAMGFGVDASADTMREVNVSSGEPDFPPINTRKVGASPGSLETPPRELENRAPMEFDDFFGASTRLKGVTVAGAFLEPGVRVRLRPRAKADIMDLVLSGQTAIIEAVEEDAERRIHLALVLEDDPGKDLGLARQLGHRFFFGVDEVEPLREEAP